MEGGFPVAVLVLRRAHALPREEAAQRARRVGSAAQLADGDAMPAVPQLVLDVLARGLHLHGVRGGRQVDAHGRAVLAVQHERDVAPVRPEHDVDLDVRLAQQQRARRELDLVEGRARQLVELGGDDGGGEVRAGERGDDGDEHAAEHHVEQILVDQHHRSRPFFLWLRVVCSVCSCSCSCCVLLVFGWPSFRPVFERVGSCFFSF